MNSTAVHLELAKSLETDNFMLVLMRFLNPRGHVKEIRSDNGTNFVSADKEIRELITAMTHSKLERELSQRGCNWVFHPPRRISYVRGMGEAGPNCQEKPESYPRQEPYERRSTTYGVHRS